MVFECYVHFVANHVDLYFLSIHGDDVAQQTTHIHIAPACVYMHAGVSARARVCVILNGLIKFSTLK